MSQYIPDLTERFPEGFGGIDLTDNYFQPTDSRILFDRQMEKLYEDEGEYENSRKENPTCDNCKNLYEEYGYRICKKHDIPCIDWDEYNVDHAEKCDDWC